MFGPCRLLFSVHVLSSLFVNDWYCSYVLSEGFSLLSCSQCSIGPMGGFLSCHNRGRDISVMLEVTEVYFIIIAFTKLTILGAGMLREKMTSPKAALLAGAFLKTELIWGTLPKGSGRQNMLNAQCAVSVCVKFGIL